MRTTTHQHRWPFQLFLFLLLAAFALPSQAQESNPPALTLEDIHASGAFYPKSFQGGRWAEEGPVITYTEEAEGSSADSGGVTHLMRYNLETDERERLINGSALRAEDVGRLITIEGYQYSQDKSKVLLYTDSERVWRYNTKGYYYVYDLDSGDLTPIDAREKGHQMFAKFNPAGDEVAFVRARNLFAKNLSTGEVTPLTSDGEEGTIINGTFDWVYEEEFGLRDGFSWSPDGRYIAFYKLDESKTREFAMTDFTTRYPSYERFRYPKAGEANSEIKIGVINMQGEGAEPEIRYFDTGTWSDDYEGGDDQEYLTTMDWTPEIDGGHKVRMFRLNRDQNRLELLYGDPATLDLEIVLEEEEDTYIDVESEKITYLDGGEHFVFASETDGYNHLYLYTSAGEPAGRITAGEWEVTDFHGIDTAENAAYVTGTKESSMERHLYRVPFEMGAEEAAPGTPEKITEGAGWHDVNMAPDEGYYIDTYSSATQPPVVTLHRADGEQLVVLESNEALIEKLARYDLPEPEFTTVPGADGTSLNAYVIKPRGSEEGQAYPTLMYVYGGPGAQTVTNQWGGPRELWHRYLAAEHGVVVASVDNRGTGGRGKAFQDVPYKRLGIPETEDQIAAAKHLRALPYVDEDRLGIWGWSYGGYMTLLAMLYDDGPDVFDVGISVAPVTDWRFYDTIYTERYMSTPEKNESGYEEGAPLKYADRLKEGQDLLLIHGDFDDNVHVQNSMQMAQALQEANKQFDFMLYPGKNHGIYGGPTRLNLFTKMTDYLQENLIRTGEEEMASAAE